MSKQNLRWFLIGRFLVLMAVMYVCGELLNIFYNIIGFPLLYRLLSYLDIRFVSDGSVVADLLHLLFYFFVDLLPSGISEWVKSVIDGSGWGFQIGVNAAYDGSIMSRILRFALFWIVLILLELRMAPYLAGAFFYCRMVAKKMNELLEEEKEQQQAFERRRSLLLSDIAHDIKTPITTICGYSRALSEGVVEAEKRQAYLDVIYQKSLRMDELLTLLFEYVKLDSEGFTLHKEQGDLAELLREMTALLYADFEEKKITVVTEIEEEDAAFVMDRLQLGRAITNLLTNALRYGKEGGRALVRLSDGEITVADDGEPIDPAFAEHIFDPFTRADRARTSTGGSGLGLGIAKKIVEMHGGKLVLNQNFGGGYTKAFQIRLPL
ncbi:MAG: HAMP domain-containing histidine kinase [Bacteroidales bacterium]|nr:HAMP domain-containing histidine kinase [Bacteroidales bacterium]MCM1415256.1 HAMP domain-containing histidine kinase [bacterium]MCM1423280.1 HAMP domain-containing histidine kinase [bacterium]